MTQIEQIKAEIERLTEVTGYSLSEYENGRRSAMYDIRKQLIEYINSLPAAEEQPSEDLEAEIDRYFKDDKWFSTPLGDIARHFAQWQKEQMMKGFCYETRVYQDCDVDSIESPFQTWLKLEQNEITALPNIGLKEGDKVKILIIKEDEQLNNKVNIEPPSFEESQGEFNSYNVALNG